MSCSSPVAFLTQHCLKILMSTATCVEYIHQFEFSGTDIIKIDLLLPSATTSAARSPSTDIFRLMKLIKLSTAITTLSRRWWGGRLIDPPSYYKHLPSPLLLYSTPTPAHLVALHILARHLVSRAWLHRGLPMLSYSYSASILFPLLFYNMAPALLRFFIYFYRRGRLANCTPS